MPGVAGIISGRFYRVRIDPQHSLKQRRGQALGLILLCLFAITTASHGSALASPDPPPATLPFYYDTTNTYDEGQRATLMRDAELLQSSGIPIVVYVRSTTPDDARPESAQAFADTVRQNWDVETEPGQDNGLVLLYSHVPSNPRASSIVASWGDTSFENSGLNSTYIHSVLNGDARTLLDEGHPFEALVYAMRELRYGGIYFPPPPPPLTGATKALHTTMNLLAPTLLVVAVAFFVGVSLRNPRDGHISRTLVWKIVGATGVLIASLSVLSVVGRSRIGIGAALLILLALGIQSRIWMHPASTPSRNRRRKSVPSTRRRMRRIHQARHLQSSLEGQR